MKGILKLIRNKFHTDLIVRLQKILDKLNEDSINEINKNYVILLKL